MVMCEVDPHMGAKNGCNGVNARELGGPKSRKARGNAPLRGEPPAPCRTMRVRVEEGGRQVTRDVISPHAKRTCAREQRSTARPGDVRSTGRASGSGVRRRRTERLADRLSPCGRRGRSPCRGSGSVLSITGEEVVCASDREDGLGGGQSRREGKTLDGRGARLGGRIVTGARVEGGGIEADFPRCNRHEKRRTGGGRNEDAYTGGMATLPYEDPRVSDLVARQAEDRAEMRAGFADVRSEMRDGFQRVEAALATRRWTPAAVGFILGPIGAGIVTALGVVIASHPS